MPSSLLRAGSSSSTSSSSSTILPRLGCAFATPDFGRSTASPAPPPQLAFCARALASATVFYTRQPG
jgi:hypothetical protein